MVKCAASQRVKIDTSSPTGSCPLQIVNILIFMYLAGPCSPA